MNTFKTYRPAPYFEDSNPDHILIRKYLHIHGWTPVMFKFWRISDLIKNRKKCRIIHMHFPEAFWRSKSVFWSYIKAVWFIYIFTVSRLLKYRWVFSAHNVLPHYLVNSMMLERVMRYFVLKNFDAVIGLAYNTKNDLELAYGTSGKSFTLALHGTYEDAYPDGETRETLRKMHSIPLDKIVILIMNTGERQNKGVEEVIEAWQMMIEPADVHLLLVGNEPESAKNNPKLRNYHFIEGRVPNSKMKELYSMVDFTILNYKNITTSGMYFLTVTFKVPVIVPNLPFFKLHATESTAIFYDYNEGLIDQFTNIIDVIKSGWAPNISAFNDYCKIHNTEKSAQKISKVYEKLLAQGDNS